MSWATLCAFYLPLALVFCGARFLARGRGAGAATALAATYSNTVFMGLPVLVQVLGPDCLQFAYPVIAFHSLFRFTLYHLGDDEAPAGRLGAVLNTLKNPIVAALLLGLALNLAQVALPAAPMQVLDMLAAAALPCALLSLGASVASLKPGFGMRTGAIVLAKLVVLASCPVGINAAFVVNRSEGGAQIVNAAILLSSLLSAATVPGWLWLLRP